MKKLISFFILLSIMSGSAVAQPQNVEEVSPGFVLLDVLLYRPVGLVATVIGAGVFIGLSPLTALASIPAPHDAFVKTGKILILAPAVYTFIRPIGNRDFPYYMPHHIPHYMPQYKQKPVARQINVEPYKNSEIPKQRTVTPVVPYVQPPQRYPDSRGGL